MNLGISPMPLTTSHVARETSPIRQGNKIQGRRTPASAGATIGRGARGSELTIDTAGCGRHGGVPP